MIDPYLRGRSIFSGNQQALEALAIEIICANSPQAKGRVERANGKLQDRLVKAMRLDAHALTRVLA